MLITRPYISPEKQLEQDLKEFGIRKCSRKLIFFVDKDLYENGMCVNGKAIQINMSCEAGILSDTIRGFGLVTKNATGIKVSVYKYNTFFPNGTSNIQEADMLLTDAYSSEEINDFDARCGYVHDTGLYNKDFSSIDRQRSMESLGSSFRNASILLPIYYTEEQQKAKEGETYSIVWLTNCINYSAHELIDPYTIVEIHDLKTYDTMIQFLHLEILKKAENTNTINSVNMISDLFIPTSESMLTGYMFIYDSNMGMNVKSVRGITQIPMGEFRLKENLISNLQGLTDLVKMEAKMIEKQHGAIRMYYTPLLSGDKLKISYLDYDKENQPDFNKTKIDKGFTIQENLITQYDEYMNEYTEMGADF